MFFYRATTQQNCVLATIRCEEFVAAVVALAPKLFDREERGAKARRLQIPFEKNSERNN
jgi:hypothetical protein